MSSDAEFALRLPYPGLRSFQRDESDLFFGREGTVNEMINRLRPNHFLAVLGTSGSGKSSLVRIGLLDGLELGLLAEAGSRWRIADFAPGANPLRNLARELSRLGGGGETETDFLEAFLARGPRSVVEWCKDGNLPRGANLLLLVDQFEELFRYQDYAERQAAEAFVALLIESARNRDVPIYVVITMRSEYLGACALIEGLAEIINDGQFLTPRLNREQCREAIVGPAAVCGTVIEEDLVNRLLNDLEDFAPWDDRDSSDQLDRLVRRADQLPLLQHTLNRLWLRADAMRADKNQPIVLSLADYDAIGGLRGAINAHADEVLARLGPALAPRAEQVFRALTDGKSLATAVRRPLRFEDLVAVCDGDEAGVRAVVDAFRETGVNFLRPDTSQPLKAETIVDISHESLIRQWRKLSGWLVEEAREAQEWTRLGEAAARYRAGEGSLYYGQDLHVWREHARPTAAWASRYNQPYQETLAFLDESLATEKKQRRFRFAAIAAAFIVVVGFGGGGIFFTQLAGKNAELTEQAALLQAATADLETKNIELTQAQTDLADSVDRLQAAQQELRTVFLGSFDANVGAYQHAGRWAEAGALLGAMLARTAHGSGAARTYDDGVVDAARMRLAGQWAFPVWPATDPGVIVPTQAGGMQPPGRFAVSWVDRDNNSPDIRLVDRLTGAVLAEATVPDGTGPATDAPHLVTADGGDAIFVSQSGNVVRWRTRSNEMVDYGPLGEPGRAVRALAYDPATGHVAFVLYAEDSEVVVLASDPPKRIFRSLLSGLDGMVDEDEENEDAGEVFDGDGVAFWAGRLVVSFDPGTGSRRYTAIDMGDELATFLPRTLVAAMPSPDGKWLFVADASGCKADDTPLLVDGDGRPLDLPLVAPDATRGLARLAPACFGVLDSPDGDIRQIGGYRTLGANEMALVDVQMLTGPDGELRHRVIINDASGGQDAGADPVLLAVDLIADGETLRPDAEPATDAQTLVPVAVVDGAGALRFGKASPAEPWQPLPAFAPLKVVGWFDSVSERTVRLADVLGSPDGPATLVLRLAEAAWPEDKLGQVGGLRVAVAGDSMLVVAGNSAGLQKIGDGTPDLVLREMTIGRECRLPSGEKLRLDRLLPWSLTTPVFFGLDDEGRVLRFATPADSRSAGSSGGEGAAVAVSCIGRVRPDADSIAIANAAADLVLLQTDPLEFTSLAATVQSEKEFSESPKVALNVASSLAALVPGERATLASVDRAGNLTVLRADPDWRVVNASRSVVVPAPVHVSATGDKLLVVGEAGAAVVVDLSTDALLPVAVGRVPTSRFGYRLLAGGSTVELVLAGSVWRVPLPALPDANALARFVEAAAGALTDSSDQDQVGLGARLTRRDDEAMTGEETVDMALGRDALCFLAANAVLEAWRAEAGEGSPGARLTAARDEAAERCAGTSALATMGQRLVATAHYISPALDPWPAEWSALLQDAIAGNRLASRAVLVGLANSADPFASAAGEWLNSSATVIGLEVPESVLEDAASGAPIDPALQEVVEEQRETYEPAIHELLGHIALRNSGGDPALLREAWVHFRIAELLYGHQIGRGAEADRTAELRATIARALPADALIDSWREAGTWTANIDAMVASAADSSGLSLRERMRADAERIAELEAGSGDDLPFHLLQAYLWLNVADIEAAEAPADAPASYARFADILTSLPPLEQLSSSMSAALADASRRLVELAGEGRLGDSATAAALAPFILGLAEPDVEGTWDAASLTTYADTVNSVIGLLSTNPAAVPEEALERLRFAERRFGHGFRLDDDETLAAGAAALEARLALLDLLVARDPTRWDWLAAKGTTEFWIGYRVHSADETARMDWLARAIRDLSAAHGMAGADFPAESLYWLTEARRWLPQYDAAQVIALSVEGIEDYETLNDAFDGGDWNAPLDGGELLASNAELLAKLADSQAKLLFDRADDWSPDDPAVQDGILDGLYYIAEWDRIRARALAAGSTWSSTRPGYSNAPGNLLGSVGGRLYAERNREAADDCDRLASFPADPLRRAPAVAFEDLDFETAIAACRALWSAAGDDPRLNFQLGRVLWTSEDRDGFALDVLQTAANGGYAPAFNSLAGYLEIPGISVTNGDVIHLDLRAGFAQRAVQATFADVHAYLAPLAVTTRHRAGLRWLIERAASLGSAEAHIALARLADTPREDWAYHLEVAALLLEDTDEERAEEIRAEIPAEDFVDAADRAEDEWRVEELVGVPADLIDQLKGVTN